MISLKAYTNWINKAPKTARITYYRGYLCGPWLQKLSPTMDERRVRTIKQHVYKAADSGVVTLVQKKHEDFDYEYIAVRI